MALLGLLVILLVVPRASRVLAQRESSVSRQTLGITLKNPELLRLNIGIGTLHAILMASFVALPLALVDLGGLPKEQHWWVYLAAMSIGFCGMVPFIIYGEKKRQMKRVLVGAVSMLLFCELFFWQFGTSLHALVLGNVLFFAAFNLLEASLPSLVSKIAPAGGKGTAMGIYSTSQFLGAALGGMLGGWLYQHGSLSAVFIGCALLALLWLGFAATMREPPYVTSLRYPLSAEGVADTGLNARILAVPGVSDAIVVNEESALYIKVDTQKLDRALLERELEEAPVTQSA
jgi:predicted MFS family arabinose efflux permease